MRGHERTVRVTYDEDTDAAYIYLVDEILAGGVSQTVPMDPLAVDGMITSTSTTRTDSSESRCWAQAHDFRENSSTCNEGRRRTADGVWSVCAAELAIRHGPRGRLEQGIVLMRHSWREAADEVLELLGLAPSQDDMRVEEARAEPEGMHLPEILAWFYAHPQLLTRLGSPWNGYLSRRDELKMVHDLDTTKWVGPAVEVMVENQGVCSWMVPLVGPADPPVYVVGHPRLNDGQEIAEFSPSFSTFLRVLAWHGPQAAPAQHPAHAVAQAAPTDLDDLDLSEAGLQPVVSWVGWPCSKNVLLIGPGCSVELWACDGQCDWTVTADSHARLERLLEQLLSVSDLASSMWSPDAGVQALLERLQRSQ